MKKTNVILIILLSCLSINFYAQKKNPDTSHNFISFSNLLVQQSTLSIKKHSWILALAPLIMYHHRGIKEFIIDWPYISSLGFYLLLNYACDSILQYQQQESLLNIIALLKKITLYLVISHGIKNYMHHKKLSIKLFFNDEKFLDTITVHLPYSFNEVSLITLKSYQELKTFLESVNSSLHIESEEFIFLCYASSITIENLLYLTQKNPVLYDAIYNFEKNPQEYLEPLVTYLTSEITTNFINLEKLLSILNLQAYAT